MTDYPHVPAAFINAIAEEGTKAEAIEYLQKQWNETCALRAELNKALREIVDLRMPISGAAQAEREPLAWLDVRTAGLGWQNRIVATNPQFVENNGPENFVALYASPVPSTDREGK